ncbi:MAG: hypothetical protein LUD25_00435 [Coriobacteriaceae bacterium]|nr:hypothetical protein [Coriobacteriaceae bacterium]
MDEQIETLRKYMEESKKTVAITGAGISYLYGVGRLKQQTSRAEMTSKLSPRYVKKNPDEFYALMKDAFLDATFEKGPGPVHKQLVELEKKGLLQGIITQNMDCLHTAAGSTNVVEFQGSFADNVCVDCGKRYNDYTVWGHGEIPRCPECGGPLMPANFNRRASGHDSEFKDRMEAAADMLSDAELVIVIGTTGFLSEEYMYRMNPQARLVQINPSPTKFDQMATMNIHEDAEKVLGAILAEE